MANSKVQLYRWAGLKWSVEYVSSFGNIAKARCPEQNCNCELIAGESHYGDDNKLRCVNCNFKISLDKSIDKKKKDFLRIHESYDYKDAEVINLDGELIRVQRGEKKDDDYWIDVKISKNKKEELQLMVLAGSRKSNEKVQLFLDPANERLAFDQNNDHPTKIFSKVTAIFKNSSTSINEDGSI